MDKSINWLIKYFTENSIEFYDIFKSGLASNKRDNNRKTAKGFCGIIVPIKGECIFGLNKKRNILNNNNIIHAGSFLDIDVETNDLGIEYYVIHYKAIKLKDDFINIDKESFNIQIEDRLPLIKLCETLIEKSLKPDHYSKFSCKVDFMNLLGSIIESARETQYNEKLKLVNKGLEFIKKNFNQQISISEIAEMLEVDRRRFSDIFQEVTGLSPIKYLTEYRLKEAKRLLKFSENTISEIAYMTGYNDCFYFSKSFKKNFDICPKKYREYNKNVNQIILNK